MMNNRFICDKCGKAFPLAENGFSKYYLLNGKAVCKECYEKLVKFSTYEDFEK